MNYGIWLLLSVFLSIFSLYSQVVEEQKKLYISKINFSSSVPESIRSSLGNRIKLITIQRFGSKYRVVSDKDIALMNQKAAQLMKQGCDESVCMTQIADAIDADEIIYGDVFYENGSIVLSLTNLNRDKENFTLTSKSVVDLSFQEKQYEIYIKEITYKLLDPKYKMELNVIDYTDTDKKIRWDLVWRSAVLPGWGQYYYNEKFSAYLYGTLFTAGLLYNLSSISAYNQAKDKYFNDPIFYLNAITPGYIISNGTVSGNPNFSTIALLNFNNFSQNKKEYEKQFEFIYNTFSKNAILKGSFDKYVVENKNKKGTTEVDKEFLKLIEEWRESLAKDIARKNKELDIYSLNNSVQVIIDRIIFLRIAEDRNMEKYGLLQEIIGKDQIYSQLNKIFLKANDKYNSGLFKPEKWISDLDIDDKVFQNIIKYLYYPECPYELSVLPIEILGNIYEQFLGKTIRLTSAHQAKVEEKEEVRKAGGVYYTPQYIVNYIVENTVGEKINELDLFNHPRLTILDPACGSGSFLVGAYSYLLSKYLESYTDKKRLEKCLKNGLIYQVSQNTFRLGIEVKQQILINHIFGVDIDNQAVEVTKLSLLLKLMEDENTESADRLFKHSALKLLPDLSNNIKCGNSLIGNDFYNDKDLNLFDKEDMRKVNTFDWEKEFSAIFKDGGFDCVIGNPPYVRSQQIEQLVKDYLVKAYNDSASYQPDTFSFFIHKGIINLNDSGLFGYIVPNGILTNSYYSKLRYFILKNTAIKVIADLKSNVFDSASVDTSIFILKREKKLVKIENNKLFIGEYSSRLESKVITPKNVISQKALLETDKYVFNSNTNIESLSIVTKIKKSTIHLEKFVSVKAGMKVRKDFVVNEKPNDKRYRKFLLGSSINPYNLQWKNKWVCYDKSLESNFTNQAFRDEEIFLNEDKILIRQVMGENRIYATIDKEKYFIDQSIYILLPTNSSYSTEYLLALICSKLMTYFFKQTLSDRKETFPKIKGDQIKLLPIKEIISHNEKKNYNELVNKIVAVISTQKSINGSTTDSDKKLLRQKFDLLDKQIDTLVYELYGLTEEEIKIVEGVSDGIIN